MRHYRYTGKIFIRLGLLITFVLFLSFTAYHVRLASGDCPCSEDQTDQGINKDLISRIRTSSDQALLLTNLQIGGSTASNQYRFSIPFALSNSGTAFGQFGLGNSYGFQSLGIFFGQNGLNNYSSLFGLASPFTQYYPHASSWQPSFNASYGLYAPGNPYGFYNLGGYDGWGGLGSNYGFYSSWSPYGWPFNPFGTNKPKSSKSVPAEPTVLVNLQIDADISPGKENVEGLINIMDELKRRKITATVFATGEFANQANLLISQIYNDGFEVALHGYFTGEQLASMTYSQQKSLLQNAKKALEGCLSCGTFKPVIGFRPQYFSQDPNTFLVMDELALTYNCGFKVGQSPYVEGHMDDVWPFPMEGYNFCVLPVSRGDFNGEIIYLCDIGMAIGKNMLASEWGEVLSNALDHAIAQDEPLVILFHNWFTGTDSANNSGEPGFWKPFVDFLDEAKSKGASFIQTNKLVADFCK